MKLISSKSNLFYSLPQRPSPFLLPHHSSFLLSFILPSRFCSRSYLFSFNTNSRRPDCAYNPPWLDKPLISSLSPLPEDPGFEFLFLTSLWGPGFFPVEESDPKLSSGDPSERAAQSWQDQKQRHGAQGIESSVHAQTREEGWGSQTFHVALSLSLSPSFLLWVIVTTCPVGRVAAYKCVLTAALYFSFADVPWQRCDVLTTRC